MNELYHHGVKGMKWGVRRYQNKDGSYTPAGKKHRADLEFNAYKDTTKTIRTNKDGSMTIPKGFVFNRVGALTMDVNKSGGLYVSYGKDDAARYVRQLGPTPLAKLLRTSGEAIQHVSAKENLRLASDSTTASETAKLLLSNDKLLKGFNESLYSSTVTGDLTKDVTKADLQKALENPSGKEGQRLGYAVSAMLGESEHAKESRVIYDHFRKQGYDALPDLHDSLTGTSKTPMIVINPNKVEIISTVKLDKDIMRSAKKHVKSIEKLKVSELLE